MCKANIAFLTCGLGVGWVRLTSWCAERRLPKVKITPHLPASVKMKIRIVYWCDSGKIPITLYLRAEFTHRHRNSPYNIAVNSNRRLVVRDERTGHFLYGADHSTANGGFIGFISVFDELTSYDNAPWMQLTLSQKCNILLWKVVR